MYAPSWSSKLIVDGGADAALLEGLALILFENGDKKLSSCVRMGESGADMVGDDGVSILTTSWASGASVALLG